jgi:hypothetical protein
MSGRPVAAFVRYRLFFRRGRTLMADMTFCGGQCRSGTAFLRQFIGKNLENIPYFGIFTS